MKGIFYCAFSSVFSRVLAAVKCTKQSDCEADECCLDTMFFKSAWCERRFGAGMRCSAASVFEDDIYYLSCPRVDKYECLGKGTTVDGKTVMENPKCIMPL
uniref:U33-Austrotoxin-Ht1a_1 n=1 Tax=Hickmania troglodytes TaxID=489260 RepID=A0A482ZC86_9ARAC